MNEEEAQKIHHLVEEINFNIDLTKEDVHSLMQGEIKENSLLSIKQQEERTELQAQEILKAYQLDLERGIMCFLEAALQDEFERLGCFFGKFQSQLFEIADLNPGTPLEKEDFVLLDQIATRSLIENKFKEASCMWRFIIQLNIAYSRAWVGWAICEQEVGNTEMAQSIYETALTSFPDDAYVAAFAADYFFAEKHPEKSREILQTIIQHLHEANETDTLIKQSLEDQLNGIN